MSEIEATSAEKKSGDEQQRQRAYGMSLASGVNMTNCVKHCQHFFKRCNTIHKYVLIAYWMMSGYLGPVRSLDEAFYKGLDVIRNLTTLDQILKGSIFENLEFIADIKGIHCRHQGFCVLENLGLIDLLDLDGSRGSDDACFRECEDTIYGMSSRRMEYLADVKPTPESLTNMLAYQNPRAENLNVLLIRGCEFLSPGTLSHSTKLNSLTVLEISSSPCLPTDIGIVSELTHLKCLNLSDLPLETLPDNLFYKLRHLSWVIVRGCSKLCSFPSIEGLTKLVVLDLSHCTSLQHLVFLDIRYPHLQVLDLSYTPIVCGFRELSTPNLTHLSLRGSKLKHLFPSNKLPNLQYVPELHSLQVLDLSECEHLVSLFPLMNAPRLEQLNLSGCRCFTQLEEGLLYQMPCLMYLDLSWTKVKHLPSFASLTSLRKLSLRGLELDSIGTLASLSSLLVELDLAGLKISSSQEFELDFLQSLMNLQIINLSHTSVSKLPNMAKLVKLKELLLTDCQQLNVVPNLQALTNLETLDLSLPDDSSIHNRQLEIESECQSGLPFFPLPESLRKLVLTNRSGIQTLFPKTTFDNLDFLDLRGTDAADWDSKLQAQRPQTSILKSAEIHFVFGKKSNQPLGFDHFEDVSIELDALISDTQKSFNSAMATTSTIDTDNQAFKMQLQRLHRDLRYIRENIDGLKSSHNWNSSEELLQELMDAAKNLSGVVFTVDSANFNQLRQMVLKLKLLVPLKQKGDSEALQITKKKTKKKKKSLLLSKNKENISIAEFGKDMSGMWSGLLTSYKSLSHIQKQCLLCFSIFPCDEDDEKNTCVFKSLVIRKKVLIYWWVGEGFIGSHHEVNVEPNASTEPNKGMMMSTETAVGRDETNEQVFANKGLKKLKSMEEIGKQIVKVLVEKKFIEPVIRKGRESGGYYMHPFVHSFLIEQAKEEGFFHFDQETCNLTPHFSRSQRACLLKQQDKFPSSCEFWARHVNSPKRLASFESVKTLFNVNESMIDIKREWFSKMKNLHVLRLGIWRSENGDLIEVEDQKFLEDLKRMKQLRLLSLQGLPTIMKLPDSLCQLSNLIILDLKECSYLKELPADIGSLKSLTHLDITNCPLFTGLPKGISFLLKLEVLRGFVITDQHAARGSKDRNASILSRWCEKTKWCSTIHNLFHSRNNDVCTLRDLLKLTRLRELTLIVNISMFPSDEELQVFKEMKQLRKLKILWERSICTKDNLKSATKQETLNKPSRWQIKLKCWERQPSPNGGVDTEESKHLDNLEKLELWCFPHENAPEWLSPSELKNLEKLYIVGGDLTKLPGSDTNENPWNVKTLRLKHLRKLDIQWDALKNMFPQLMYMEKHQCDRLATFPCDLEGVWKSAS